MKIIIFGLGNDYKYFKDAIINKFDIVAVTDSSFCKQNSVYDNFNYIPISKINKEKYDKILICTRKYYWTIRKRLVDEFNICEDKIFDILIFEELSIEMRRLSFDKRMNKFETDLSVYKSLKNEHSTIFEVNEEKLWPLIWEYDKKASEFGSFYFWFEEWCTKKIYKLHPKNHYDIGGRINGFISRLNTFGQQITILDIREMNVPFENVKFICTNAVEMKEIEDTSLESLSILGVLESMGLGRWGDPVDPDAWYKCLKAAERKMIVGGVLYIAVPIGKEVLEFNARRVFHPKTIIENLSSMELVEFAIIDPKDERGKYLYAGLDKEYVEKEYVESENQRDRQIMGCFLFKKRG